MILKGLGVVELYDSVNKTTQSFELAHANRIMAMKDNGGWLVKDSKLIYTNEYGIVKTTDTRLSKRTDK